MTRSETIRKQVAKQILSKPSKMAQLRRSGRAGPIHMPPFSDGYVFAYVAEGRIRCEFEDFGPLPPEEPEAKEWPEPEGTWFA